MQDYTIERVGRPDLDFTGELIGQSSAANARLKIYRTKGGEFIAEVRVDPQRSEANPFSKPADLVAWVRNDLGVITEEAQAAIEQAAKNDAAFETYWTEHVE
jgi:hypothetical protein